jgi:hypothetical protein
MEKVCYYISERNLLELLGKEVTCMGGLASRFVRLLLTRRRTVPLPFVSFVEYFGLSEVSIQ